jgi:predicted dithiol-disulfide oxidoreductase (DUF899 family)
MRDLLAAERRALPWVKVEKDYVFDAPVFYKDENGDVFHTYSSYARGNEEVIGAFIYLDITPKGRNETEIMDWVRRHDEYGDVKMAHPCASGVSVNAA